MYTIYALDTRDFIPAGVMHLIFADDLRIYAPVDSLGSHQLMQSAVDGISRWCSVNGMLLSPGKSLVLKYRSDPFAYYIDNEVLPVVKSARDLGVHVSATLDFTEHIVQLTKALFNVVNAIFRAFTTRDSRLYIELYRSLVESRIVYCSPVWRPYLCKHIDLLESVRRRFLKRLAWRCHCPAPTISTITTLFDDHDRRMYCLLKDENLLDHYINVRQNSLRSGFTYSPKTVARNELIAHQFAWRICKQLTEQSPGSI